VPAEGDAYATALRPHPRRAGCAGRGRCICDRISAEWYDGLTPARGLQYRCEPCTTPGAAEQPVNGADWPRARDVVATPVSVHLGVPPAHEFPRLVRKDGSERRQTHAILIFDQPVRGPVLIGAGRYRGYGVSRPINQSEGAEVQLMGSGLATSLRHFADTDGTLSRRRISR
jgi:hypothetical protein